MIRATIIVLCVVVAVATAVAQQPSPQTTFRSGVDLVTIDVVATSANGAPVHNLTAEDFELLEDGVPQAVQTFQFIDLSSRSAIRPLPPGIASNEAEPGGLFVVVLDELGLQVDDVSQARRVADRFFKETLLPNDYVAIVRSAADSGFFLTSDRTLAFDTIGRTTGRRERTLGLEQPGAAATGAASAATSLAELDSAIETFGVGDNGRQSFRVLLDVVEQLRRIPARRKAVLWFSRGGDLPPGYFDAVEMGRITGRDDQVFSRLIDSARAANVAIYTVDPRGLETPAAEVGRDAEPFDTGLVRDLAALTGGRALLGNFPNEALARVAAENRAYYLIGYAPSPSPGKDRARKLTVRTRAPGVSLLHRRVYLPSTGTPASELSLIESALPVTGLPIALAPVAVAGEGNRRGIIVPFEVGGELTDGARVEYTVIALDPAGKVVSRAAGNVKAAAGRAVGEARLAVDAAKVYQVRVAATAAGDMPLQGLAFATVVVPEGKSKTTECSGFLFEQPGERPALRQFPRGAPMTISTMISGEKLNERGITFGLGSIGGPVERTWPVQLGRPLAKGLWRVALSLKPPLPGGAVEIRVMEDGFLLSESCRTEFVLR